MSRTYPRTVWVLTPSFTPKSVEVVQVYRSFREDYGDVTAAGKIYPLYEMYETQGDALDGGWAHIRRIKADLKKRQESLKKKIAVLDKAEKDAS